MGNLGFVASLAAVAVSPPLQATMPAPENRLSPTSDTACSLDAVRSGQMLTCNPCTSQAMQRGDPVICDGDRRARTRRQFDIQKAKPANGDDCIERKGSTDGQS